MTSFSTEKPATPRTSSSTQSGVPPRRAQATVITEAEVPYDEQLRSRRKRYLIMMSMRVPFLIAATLLYQTPWLAILIIAISIPLPWMAVLIANDRPARKPRKVVPGTINYERALAPGGREIVDSTVDET
ncbi:MAG: DUF3099 domain-containing protein, partial [Nakamurella sp.]